MQVKLSWKLIIIRHKAINMGNEDSKKSKSVIEKSGDGIIKVRKAINSYLHGM